MSSFTDDINRDILERIETIESPEYEYPPRIKKSDYIGMAVMVVVCLIGSVGVIYYGTAM